MKLKEFLGEKFKISKGAVSIPIQETIKGYKERYMALSKRGGFRHTLHRVIPGNRRIIYVAVPSETVSNFFYDVVLELFPDSADYGLEGCDIKVFSNCPSFVYTLAYVYAHWTGPDNSEPQSMLVDELDGKLPKDRLLIPGTENKLGKQPVADKPVVRNPMGLPIFDKSVYFAVFWLQDNLNYPSVVANTGPVESMAHVMAGVTDFDTLMVKRKLAEREQRRVKQRTDKVEREQRKADAKEARGMQQMNKPRSMQSAKSVNGGVRRPSRPKHFG